ncbi:MAG TPA: tRNA (guanosine(37)-N1)-methyltransferase TrmD [Chloroflexota bacterium]|nr:tRNA (guanosine(37)-N1)-methyltransferase TrmD [Chloroflexota bacterium]
MRFDVLTLFPEMFRGPFDESILKRASEAGHLEIRVHDIRAFTRDRHHTADDAPYGGGAGMVMIAPPIFDAVEAIRDEAAQRGQGSAPWVVLLAPQGRRFSQQVAEEYARREQLVLICGHYEGIDARVREHLVDDTLSVGDFILTGGELPAMIVVDTVARLIPGVLGASESLAEESISSGLLEYPQYTRPAEYRGWPVPSVLLSGNHAAIARWRRDRALRETYLRRPDLLLHADLTAGDLPALRAMVPDGEAVREGASDDNRGLGGSKK